MRVLAELFEVHLREPRTIYNQITKSSFYAPAESLWLLDWAMPYCRILYSSAL